MKKPRNPALRLEARLALEQGLKRFTPTDENRCALHNGEHYAINGQCCVCNKTNKKPEVQKAYWQTVKTEWSAKRKARYKESKA